jgi:hypothetical protein
MPTKTALTASQYKSTGVMFTAVLNSNAYPLELVEGFVALLRGIVDAIQEELRAQTGQEVELLAELSIQPGSIKVTVEIKVAEIMKETRKIVTGVVAAVMIAFGAQGTAPTPPPPPASSQCSEMLHDALHQFHGTAQQRGVNYQLEFDFTCDGARLKANFDTRKGGT